MERGLPPKGLAFCRPNQLQIWAGRDWQGRYQTSLSILQRTLHVTFPASPSYSSLSTTLLVFFPSFMFPPARSHGRALHAVLQPCARLNLANDLGRRTWNGPLQRRWDWSKQGVTSKSEVYEDYYAAATKLKDTGVFGARKKKGSKKDALQGDGARVNLVNSKLASTTPNLPH